LKRDHRSTRLKQHSTITSNRKAGTMTTEEPPDTSTTNLTEAGAKPDILATDERAAVTSRSTEAPQDTVDTTSLAEAAAPTTSRDYVTPLIHVRIPERAVNLGLIAALGAVAVVGAIELPVAGAAAAGLYLLRSKHDQRAKVTTIDTSART
jgi:hypothetical protein